MRMCRCGRCSIVAMALVAMALVVGLASPVLAADPASSRFYEAYYLDHEKGQSAVAAKLYEQVVDDLGVSSEVRREARVRLAAIREDIASSDLARLMPEDTLAYVELNEPGAQARQLLESMGLLRLATDEVALDRRRVAVSPALVEGVLGIRGIAGAVTGFDPKREAPQGVVVLNPGRQEIVRGLIETGLPIGGATVEPIAGHATFDIEGHAFVTVTSRLVIAGTSRELVEGAIDRMEGRDSKSLATSRPLGSALADREGSLVYFCVNAKSLMPVVKGMIQRESSPEEFRVVETLLDLDSIRSFSGRAGVASDGLFVDVSLTLDEGHKNLVFNFLRTPEIDTDTMRFVPEGAAAFVVGAFNDATSRFQPKGSPIGEDDAEVVTALDLGREIFANISTLAISASPRAGDARSGPPIPELAAVFRVRDAKKSEALWRQGLGIASVAGGAGDFAGEAMEIEGQTVRRYALPEGFEAFLAVVDSTVILGSSRTALGNSIRAGKGGGSVVDDLAFAPVTQHVTTGATKGVFVHAGRVAQMVKPFMRERELREAGPILDALSETVASLTVRHTGESLRVGLSVKGIPKIGGILSEMVTWEFERDRERRVAREERRLEQRSIREEFEGAAARGDDETARTIGQRMAQGMDSDAQGLNNFAWALLTESRYVGRFNDLALRCATRANELTDHENWAYLDTLAVATFEVGHVNDAIRLEKKAIELCQGSGRRALESTLARFENAGERRAEMTPR